MTTITYFVYALQSLSSKRLYVGISDQVSRRVKAHNSRHTKSTAPYIPWELKYCERCSNRLEAREREKYLKSGYGKEQLKLILISNPEESLNCDFTFLTENHVPYVLKKSML